MTYHNFKLDIDADGIALVTWDMPGRSMNVIDLSVIEELGKIIEKVATDTAIKGAVVTSGKDTFSGGADLTMLEGMGATFAEMTRAQGEEAATATAGGIAIAGDIDRYVRAFDVKTGKVLWQSRLGTSAQGFPITYSVDGKQYIAVMTGLGGGSPRNAPAAIAPEIKIPQAGQALYVYALDDQQ